jgi:transcriptional regulator with XRE-family HTH domain
MLEYDKKKLGSYLKQVREAAGLTQYDVSSKLGYTSPQFISNIERGISVVPLKALAKMIHMYKVSPDNVVKIILDSQKKLLKQKLSKIR